LTMLPQQEVMLSPITSPLVNSLLVKETPVSHRQTNLNQKTGERRKAGMALMEKMTMVTGISMRLHNNGPTEKEMPKLVRKLLKLTRLMRIKATGIRMIPENGSKALKIPSKLKKVNGIMTKSQRNGFNKPQPNHTRKLKKRENGTKIQKLENGSRARLLKRRPTVMENGIRTQKLGSGFLESQKLKMMVRVETGIKMIRESGSVKPKVPRSLKTRR